MADFEQTMKEIFGDGFAKLSAFQGEQMKKLQSKFQELAHDAMRDEMTRINTELSELRNRVTVLETERAQRASEGLEQSF